MKNLLILSSVLLLLLSFSCNKDDDPIEETISAGVYDHNFYYHKLNPVFDLNPVLENGKICYNAADSLMLVFGADSAWLHLKLKYVNPDSLKDINQSDTFILQLLSIRANGDFLFGKNKRSYYAGLGMNATLSFVTDYRNNEPIGGQGQEFFSGYKWQNMWEKPAPPPDLTHYDGGNWFKDNFTAYIGFKYKGRLGWIEVEMTDAYSPRIISYALEK